MLCFLKSILVFTSACLLVLHFKHLCSSRSALNSSQFTDIGVLKMFLPQAVLLVNPDPLLFRCIWYDISHLLVGNTVVVSMCEILPGNILEVLTIISIKNHSSIVSLQASFTALTAACGLLTTAT